MNILITICARGGSKGLPGKNIREIAGKPLLAYSIMIADKFVQSYNEGLAVMTLSTDSEEIRKVAAEHGLVTDYLRPAAFAIDSVSKTPALEHVLAYEEKRHNTQFDYIIDFDVTSPLRTVEDIYKALEVIIANKDAVNLITVSAARRNPYFNMVEQKENGYYNVVKKPSKPFYSRQEAPKVYDMNSAFYIFTRRYFEDKYVGTFNDKTMIYEIHHTCLDVDTIEDFNYLEYVMTSGKWTF